MSEPWTALPGLEPERYELHEGPAYEFELDRRDFLKSLGGGILVLCLVDATSAQQPGAQRRGGAGRVRSGVRAYLGARRGVVLVHARLGPHLGRGLCPGLAVQAPV